MTPVVRFRLLALLVLAPIVLVGCGESVTPETTSVNPTPPDVLAPEAPEAEPVDAAQPTATATAEAVTVTEEETAPTPTAEAPEPTTTEPTAEAPEPKADETAAATEADGVTLTPLSFEEFQKQVATNPKAKYTLVDAWATNCAPCKENFPHLVEMHHKYGDQGLAVASISLDDREDEKAIEEAKKFLKEKGATFTNVLLDEDFGVGYEQLRVNAIPAVFVYGPDGKEVKRYTMDDPDNQFTYDQVENDIAAMLKGEGTDASAADGEAEPKSEDAEG